MAWTKIFPARKYTKYISWDILITIACAFAISKAMVNSGVADTVAHYIIAMSDPIRASRLIGDALYHHQYLYRAYHQQCGGGLGLPVGSIYICAVRGESGTVFRGYMYGGFLPAFLPRLGIKPT